MNKITFFLVFFCVLSCTERSKVSEVPENAFTFKIQNLETVTLGNTKYKRQMISGLNRALDTIRDRNGDILILQLEPRKILKFNTNLKLVKWIGVQRDGSFTAKWENPSTYFGESLPVDSFHSEPHSFVVDPRGASLVAVVYYGRADNQNANTIGQYDLGSGSFVASFGMISRSEFSKGFTTEEKQSRGDIFFRGIVNAIYDKDHNLYVSDYANCSLAKFNADYKFQGWVGLKNTNILTNGWSLDGVPKCSNVPGAFDRLHGIAFDSKGNFYVADTWNHRIQKFGADGKFQGWLGAREDSTVTSGWEKVGNSSASKLLGGFNTPIAIKIDKDDNIYLLELVGNRLQKFSPEGKNLWSLTDLKGSFGLQVYDNEFIVSDTGNQRVVIFTRE